ncbi:MAG: hypothetical protein FWC28_02950 [Proteobacteria bacterium]|nr:hypothetical protein [Cystobacterineae bacterium]MCL2259357.1 hypothetical protein [Cystobacterineae bacterium]MCL2314196.1 hypothetical protein [Pseudomonadota bacterium]
MNRFCLVVAVALLGMGCAHKSLDVATLSTIQKPAFVGRILKDAGPKATVFTDDNSFREGLKKLEPAEGNRRMAARMLKGLPHYELSDGLRARTMLRLGTTTPFQNAADPSQVARTLGIFLTQDEADSEPNYQALSQLNVDSIIEFVIEEYGIRSAQGKLRFWVSGHGRMFRLQGGGTLWKRSFYAEEEASTLPTIDPFVMAKDSSLYRNRIHWVLDTVAQKFAEDLSPGKRMVVAAPAQEAPAPVVLPPANAPKPTSIDEDPL